MEGIEVVSQRYNLLILNHEGVLNTTDCVCVIEVNVISPLAFTGTHRHVFTIEI